MTIRVVIERPKDRSTYKAYALAEGNRRGNNLLRPGIRDLEAAKTGARERLIEDLKGAGQNMAASTIQAPEIVFTVEDNYQPAAARRAEDAPK